MIHENVFQSPLSTHCFVSSYISDLQSLKKAQSSNTAGTTRPPRWIPPPSGLMKINVDAALSKNTGKVVAAAVARDGSRVFLGASALVIEGTAEPETVEALACREGLALASDLLLRSFRLASDNANVIRSIKEPGMGVYGHIVREIKARTGDFQVVDFVHERRLSNVDAHILARSNVSVDSGRHLWLLSPPEIGRMYVL